MVVVTRFMDSAAILRGLYLFGAVLMLWSAVKITGHFGWRTSQERWALLRRAVYWMLTMSLLCLGFGVDGFLSRAMLLLGIILFPLMRAVGLISQDIVTSKPLSVLTKGATPFPAWSQRADSIRRLAERLRSKAKDIGDPALRKTLLETAEACEEMAVRVVNMFEAPQ